jgi:dCMP deaminase
MLRAWTNWPQETSKQGVCMRNSRLSWDQMLMAIADCLGQRSSCIHHQIGCVFVDDLHRVITVGYNGSPRGDANCVEVGCAKLDAGGSGVCRGAHSEINGIINCVHPERLRGSTLYLTTFPCHACMKALVQAGVKSIIYRDEYVRLLPGNVAQHEDEARHLAQRMGVEVRRYIP